MTTYDAVVVGAGPNGLAAAATLARAGCSVHVLEAADRIGGGTRTEAITLPGFLHDVCSAIHPLGVASPAFQALPLAEHGLRWVQPDAPAAHPLPDGTAALLEHSLDATAQGLGEDGRAWRRIALPLVEHWEELASSILAPVLRPPSHPLVMGRFGIGAIWPATTFAHTQFRTERARALFTGLAGHSILDLRKPLTASFGLTFMGTAHTGGWPMAAGGSGRIADALASYLAGQGGTIETGRRVTSLTDLPPSRALLFDVTPRQLLAIAGDALAPAYRARLRRFRYGPGAFKVDYALDGPVPWKAPEVARAGSVHVGGTMEEIAAGEAEVARGGHPEAPYVLCTQTSLFDPSRAPEGQHTFWAYCHVPNGSSVDMTDRIEAQIERFAPGFKDRVLARHAMGPAAIEAHDANYIGGDITGGSHGGLQLVARPMVTPHPYSVPMKDQRAFLCSSSTPPGAGVHGMCGWWAAQAAMKELGLAPDRVPT
ncbi:MAG TPA: NAD(P)/FAD-dependent oxidoreductase [Actinomycetota bacterium]|nr:NAD(P)/FAD-dependent oxidoreductase [Actinomycetota bacterium]